ncbi:hypothetical protein [Paracidovorax sp. MALMAid1276]|uniref:hypothetical protein n=1 Tax=Paracidovorax sp. MALMAid1276 TaxID=3411631 RepID=UPI003B9CCFCA
MLTQIEWWGGVILVLGALTYRMVMGALDKPAKGIPWYRLLMHVFFLAPATLLAGYFYPLTQPALQYGYLALLAVALLVVAVMLVQEMTGDAGEDDDQRGAKDGTKDSTKAAEDDEPGWLMTVVGATVFYSPVLTACGLACAKAWPMVQPLL